MKLIIDRDSGLFWNNDRGWVEADSAEPFGGNLTLPTAETGEAVEVEPTVSIKSYVADHVPRLIWQKMFDLYRGLGCNLDNLTDLLIDYEYIQEQRPTQIIWGINPPHYMTAIYLPSDSRSMRGREYMEQSSDIVWQIDIGDTSGSATFTLIKPRQQEPSPDSEGGETCNHVVN